MQYSCLGQLIRLQLYLVGGELCSIKTSIIILMMVVIIIIIIIIMTTIHTFQDFEVCKS